MAKIDGVANRGIFDASGRPNLDVRIDREKSARYGPNTGDVNAAVQATLQAALQAALGSTVAAEVPEADRTFATVIRLDPKFRSDVDTIRNRKVAYPTPSRINAHIPLSELAAIALDTGASFINRKCSQRYIPIKLGVRGRDLGRTAEEARRRSPATSSFQRLSDHLVRRVRRPSEQPRLLMVVPITLMRILVLSCGLFNSLRDSLLAVTGMPFAIKGGLIAPCLAALVFSVSAAIGFIWLFGVAVMDGIPNITCFSELHALRMRVAEPMFRGAEQRMRPMLTTALSAGIGLFPAAISNGIGSQVPRRWRR